MKKKGKNQTNGRLLVPNQDNISQPRNKQTPLCKPTHKCLVLDAGCPPRHRRQSRRGSCMSSYRRLEVRSERSRKENRCRRHVSYRESPRRLGRWQCRSLRSEVDDHLQLPEHAPVRLGRLANQLPPFPVPLHLGEPLFSREQTAGTG